MIYLCSNNCWHVARVLLLTLKDRQTLYKTKYILHYAQNDGDCCSAWDDCSNYTLHGSGAHWHLGHPTGKYPWEQVVAVQVYRHIGCTLTSVLKQNRWLLDSSEAIPASIDYIVKQSGINVFKLYNLYSVYVKRNSRRCILAVGIKTF